MPTSSITTLIILTLTAFEILIHGGEAVKILKLSVPNFVTKGHNALLTCDFDMEGMDLYSVRWYKNGFGFYRYISPAEPQQTIYNFTGATIDVSRSDERTVALREVNIGAEGTYICEVMGGPPTFKTDSTSAEMQEVGDAVPKVTIMPPGDQYVKAGSRVQLDCHITDAVQLPSYIFWYHEEKSVLDQQDRNLTVTEKKTGAESITSTITIPKVNREDSGNYKCMPTNLHAASVTLYVLNAEPELSVTVEPELSVTVEPELSVTVEPELSVTFESRTLEPGSLVSLECVAKGNPTPRLTWELYGNRLSYSERMKISQKVSTDGEQVVSQLDIDYIDTYNSGLYACVASSTMGSIRHASRINVYGLLHIRPMEKVTVAPGENLIVYCPVAGHPIASIVWERNGRILPTDGRQRAFSNGTLIIETAQRADDQGLYTCVARNSVGYVAYGDLHVQVMGEQKCECP